MKYKDVKTNYKMSEAEVNKCLCMLIIFCEMNQESHQATKMKNRLEKFEKQIHNGKFKN